VKRFRQIFYSLLPWWLTNGEGELVQYVLGLMRDHMATRARLSLEARFPSRAGASALALIGADRGIIRGRAETRDAYVNRLKAWRYPRGHRVRGDAQYWGATDLDVFTVSQNLVRNRREPDGTETTTYSTEWNWDNGDPAHWGRFWVVMLCQPAMGVDYTPYFGDPSLWEYNDVTACIGLTGVTPEDVVAMRRLLRGRAWKPAGVRAEWMVFSKDAVEPVLEAGDWGRWGVDSGGVRVAARSADYRYVSLSPEANNTYPQGPTRWPATVTLVDGTTYDGDPTSFDVTAVPLPGGRLYTGNPTRFPVKVQLVDDGDAPRAF
jgi:hypothetical protein